VSGTSVGVNMNTGVPYSVASARGWLLKDSSGAYLKNLAYPDNFIGDVGSAAYQAEWARRVGAYVSSVGIDGVFIDEVIADISTMSGTLPAKYPSQPAWEDAMAAFVASVGRSLRNRGMYVLVNAHKYVPGNTGSDDGSLEAKWWQRLGPYVSGLHREYFLQAASNTSQLRSDGTAWYDHWAGWTNLISVTQAMGRDFFGMTYGSMTNLRAMRYCKASFLLNWDGGGGAFIYAATDSTDPWHSAWTTDIGYPVAAKSSLAPGVWMRRFERGTVVVNASKSVVTVSVDGLARSIGATDALIITA
jgi:hypothetical protein